MRKHSKTQLQTMTDNLTSQITEIETNYHDKSGIPIISPQNEQDFKIEVRKQASDARRRNRMT